MERTAIDPAGALGVDAPGGRHGLLPGDMDEGADRAVPLRDAREMGTHEGLGGQTVPQGVAGLGDGQIGRVERQAPSGVRTRVRFQIATPSHELHARRRPRGPNTAWMKPIMWISAPLGGPKAPCPCGFP